MECMDPDVRCPKKAVKLITHSLGSIAAEMPVKFKSDMVITKPNLAASRLREILR